MKPGQVPLKDTLLEVKEVCKTFNGQPVLKNITFSIRRGEFFSLLGPSGVGKTTLLRIIAGLEVPDSGEIILEDRVVGSAKHYVPPEKRGVGLVFQDLALFPHLTVFENVAFGLSGLGRQERDARVRKFLAMIGLEHKAKRFPAELSGGECQRVALARALAPHPKILLLDEPFSNLDRGLREKMREEVKKITKDLGITALLVTHDQEEALILSDRLGIFNPYGLLEQVGTPKEIYLNPKTLFVSQFVGKANLIRGRIVQGKLHTPLGILSVKSSESTDVKEVYLMIRPEDLAFQRDQAGSGLIKEISFLGSDVLVSLEFPGKIILQALCRTRDFFCSVGDRVSLTLDKCTFRYFEI